MVLTYLANRHAPLLEVRHVELQRFGDGEWKSICPVCGLGILFGPSRNALWRQCTRYDRCTRCAQLVKYTDATINGEGFMESDKMREELALDTWTDGDNVPVKVGALKGVLGAMDEWEVQAGQAHAWLSAWQDWAKKLHHTLRLLPDTRLPDDTAARETLGALALEVEGWRDWGAAVSLAAGTLAGELARAGHAAQAATLVATMREMPGLEPARIAKFLGAEMVPAVVTSELRRARFEATLLAKAWTERAELEQDSVTRAQIDTLAAQHYRKGELEPNGDRVPHPWRMTPELAECLTEMTVLAEQECVGAADWNSAVHRLVAAAKGGLTVDDPTVTLPRETVLELLRDAQGLAQRGSPRD